MWDYYDRVLHVLHDQLGDSFFHFSYCSCCYCRSCRALMLLLNVISVKGIITWAIVSVGDKSIPLLRQILMMRDGRTKTSLAILAF